MLYRTMLPRYYRVEAERCCEAGDMTGTGLEEQLGEVDSSWGESKGTAAARKS